MASGGGSTVLTTVLTGRPVTSGQAANGDICRTTWSGDYKPEIEKESADSWQLFLTANRKGLTYDKIRVTIAKKTFRPLTAEYLTVSGTPLKRAQFSGYKKIAGGIRPTEIIITDSKRKNKTSKIIIREMKVQSFPTSMFKRSQLKVAM